MLLDKNSSWVHFLDPSCWKPLPAANSNRLADARDA